MPRVATASIVASSSRTSSREPFHADGYGFQVELVMRSWLRGWSLGEVPITFREREHGHSKLSRRIVVEALWLVTRWGIALRATGRPYRGGPSAGLRRPARLPLSLALPR